MKNEFLRVVQITDTHLFADRSSRLKGINTTESLQAVLDTLKQDATPPDLILLTGDLAQDESEAAYLYLAQVTNEFAVPCYWVPGNHDSVRNDIQAIYPQHYIFNQKHIVLDHWQIILLDSQIHGEIEGYLAPDQLTYLTECLNKHPKLPALVGFHHPAWLVHSTWIDSLELRNIEEFWQTACRHEQLKIVLCGHVHQESKGQQQHISYFSTPSTCFQFKALSNKFALDTLPPGYRWLNLHPDGKFTTGVVRAENFSGHPDESEEKY